MIDYNAMRYQTGLNYNRRDDPHTDEYVYELRLYLHKTANAMADEILAHGTSQYTVGKLTSQYRAKALQYHFDDGLERELIDSACKYYKAVENGAMRSYEYKKRNHLL